MYFNRFTQRAKAAIDLGVDSAKRLGHKVVGSEHILLGLLKEQEGIAAKVLTKLGVTEEYLESKIIELEGKNEIISEDITLSPRAKQILELSGMFANKLKNKLYRNRTYIIGNSSRGRRYRDKNIELFRHKSKRYSAADNRNDGDRVIYSASK